MLEAVVIPVPDETVTNKLHAHVVVKEDIKQSELVRFIAQRVPRYMIPDQFTFSEVLPKTSTGKIDRQALAATPIAVGNTRTRTHAAGETSP
jgi:acyl-coenzyme A synthetase/AMP-(fatty) acid ligase